MKFDVDLAEIW